MEAAADEEDNDDSFLPGVIDVPGQRGGAADSPPGRLVAGHTHVRGHAVPHPQAACPGGIGKVSVAFDAELQREVALKQIKPERADDADSRTRFLLEAEVTGRLEHPGIVPVYGLGSDDGGRPFYAMRFVRGTSFEEAISQFHRRRRGPRRDPRERSLALRHLLDRFVDVCQTVAYAHSRGVLHRDLKPANILLGPFNESLVVDWGLAKVFGRGPAETGGEAERSGRPSRAARIRSWPAYRPTAIPRPGPATVRRTGPGTEPGSSEPPLGCRARPTRRRARPSAHRPT